MVGSESQLVGSTQSSISQMTTTSGQVSKPIRQPIKTPVSQSGDSGAGSNVDSGEFNGEFNLKVPAGESSGYIAPNVKGQHLLKLGPQLFKDAFGLLKDSHKTKGQQQSAVKHQSSNAVSQSEPTRGGDEVPGSDSTTSPFLQKEGPHHVLLAPSVYGEVTNVKETSHTQSFIARSVHQPVCPV